MARPIRIEFEGALYHLTSRGDRREAIYEDDGDRARFLELLGEVAGGFNWVMREPGVRSRREPGVRSSKVASGCGRG